jgi:hypothetical protein
MERSVLVVAFTDPNPYPDRVSRREERFYWIAGTSLLLDVIVYRFIDSFFGFFLIFTLQVAILSGLAARLGVRNVAALLAHLFHGLVARLGLQSTRGRNVTPLTGINRQKAKRRTNGV